MDCLGSSYSHIQQQQEHIGLTALEHQDYDMDPFRQGLTPPRMPGDHMHPYGKDFSTVVTMLERYINIYKYNEIILENLVSSL